jgi:hypothetical protein
MSYEQKNSVGAKVLFIPNGNQILTMDMIKARQELGR